MDTIFFIASKLFWVFARPESWIVLLLLAALLASRQSSDRVGRRYVKACLGFILAIGILPVGELLMRPLETRFPADPVASAPAGIIILGGAEDGTGMRTTGLPGVNEAGERFLVGMALARAYPEAQLIFTGGSGQVLSEGMPGAEIAARIFASGGIEVDRVLLESQSRNTAENAAYSLDLVGERAGPWILVTSAFHMPRAVGSFCAAGWRNIVPYPVDFRGVDDVDLAWDLGAGLTDLNIGVKEWIGIFAYRVTGRMESFWPSAC